MSRARAMTEAPRPQTGRISFRRTDGSEGTDPSRARRDNWRMAVEGLQEQRRVSSGGQEVCPRVPDLRRRGSSQFIPGATAVVPETRRRGSSQFICGATAALPMPTSVRSCTRNGAGPSSASMRSDATASGGSSCRSQCRKIPRSKRQRHQPQAVTSIAAAAREFTPLPACVAPMRTTR